MPLVNTNTISLELSKKKQFGSTCCTFATLLEIKQEMIVVDDEI